jgi:mannosyl-oligosaccharide alpha-1,2-mannosidase
MELPEVVVAIVDFVPTIDFSHTNTPVSLFETNIRYLGGMISAYDLLTGPFSTLLTNGTKKESLLSQSKKLADLLSIAFDTHTGIPENTLHFLKNHRFVEVSRKSSLADVGTLVLEWTRLSDLLNDPKYTRLAQKAESYVLNPIPTQWEPFPALLSDTINSTTGMFVDSPGGWGGSSDSFYEYLLKVFVYSANRFEEYRDRWTTAAHSTMVHLASHPSSRPDLTFLSRFYGQNVLHTSGHSTYPYSLLSSESIVILTIVECFAGGNFLLGGSVLKEQKYIDFGLVS